MGPKWAHSTCLCTANSPKVSFQKRIFDPFLTDFWSQGSPFSRHVGTLEWPKWLAMGSKRAQFTCLGTPNGLGSFLEKHIFDPFLTHFLSQNNPFSRHIGTLGGLKRATTSSRHAKNTCFGIPCGPGSFLKKVIVLHPVDLVDPFWHPPLWTTCCTLPQATGPRYGGRGVGNFEGWKPPKGGGCGWMRCARNCVLSHVAQGMVCFWFGTVGGQCARILGLLGAFWGLFVDILWG